jgi:hypothetical protein
VSHVSRSFSILYLLLDCAEVLVIPFGEIPCQLRDIALV